MEMGDLNAKVGFHNIFLGHMMEGHDLCYRKNNGDRLVNFSNFQVPVIDGVMFEHRPYHKEN